MKIVVGKFEIELQQEIIMKITEVKKYLNTLTNEQTIEIILKMYNLSVANKNYVINKINPEYENNLLVEYKNIIENEFAFQHDDFSLDFKTIKNSIKQYQSISCNPKNVIELILFYVECGINFTQDYGDIGEKFYDDISNAYHDALKCIFKHNLSSEFKNTCLKLQVKANGIGYGFSDYMSDLFYGYYIDIDEDS